MIDTARICSDTAPALPGFYHHYIKERFCLKVGCILPLRGIFFMAVQKRDN